MGALAVPKKMTLTKTNGHLCARLGVKFNGKEMGNNVHAYDMIAGTITIGQGIDAKVFKGKVEPYWR